MHILLHDYGGYPFIYDLSKALSERGYSITHIYSSASGSPQGVFSQSERLRVIDLGENLEKVNKNSFLSRFRQENSYGTLIAHKIKELQPDIVISGNTPLEAQKKIASVCRMQDIYFIHWLQDVLSIAAENVLKKKSRLLGRLVGSYFRYIEKKCLEAADHIIVISDDFYELLLKWRIDGNKMSVIENWSNVDAIPIVAKENEFSRKYGITDTFNLVYSGTLGMKQNPDALIGLARSLRAEKDVRVVVVAAGSGVAYVKEEAGRLDLKNMLILPLQPFEELPNVLGSGDLLIAMLEPDASVYCVPSKILTYYCAGKPSLLILTKSNLAARKTIEHQLGFVIEPGQPDALKSLVDYTLNNRVELRQFGKRAREYSEKHFNIEHIINRFIPLFKGANL